MKFSTFNSLPQLKAFVKAKESSWGLNSKKQNLFILGGRFADIFGTGVDGGTSSTGFCGEELAGNTSGIGLVEFGYKASRSGSAPVTYSLNLTTNVNVTT